MPTPITNVRLMASPPRCGSRLAHSRDTPICDATAHEPGRAVPGAGEPPAVRPWGRPGHPRSVDRAARGADDRGHPGAAGRAAAAAAAPAVAAGRGANG